jgi:4-amino-4-deoxy-L-arabinose transferase-like glycosyltransferase
VFVLLTVLWVITLAGIHRLPLESHEAFVLASAQEMKTGGDWILPRFNETLRLNKPPLNYWATMLASAVDPVNSDIQIYHGRIVSLLAGLIMVLLTARTAGKLYGKEAGLLAALLLMGTTGFLRLSHNSRPDFLYSAFCVLQLFAWIDAWKADGPARKWYCWMGWLAAGLATLTKGPQVPVVFLLGTVIFLMTGPDRRNILKILRPFSGTLLFCLLILPWWILLQQRLKTAGMNIADSQLSGSLLLNLASWQDLLSLYYLWMPFLQMLPISLLFLLFLPRLIKNRTAMLPSTRLLVYVSITMIIVFTLGGHYRKHYMLPLFPVFAIFMANNILAIHLQGLSRKWVKIISGVAITAAIACAGFMIWEKAYVMLALFPLLGLLIACILKQELTTTFREQSTATKQLLVIAAVAILLGAGYNAYLPTTPWRDAEQEFSKRTGEQISKNDLLVSWKITIDILPYYAKQGVAKFRKQSDLIDYVADQKSSHRIYAVLATRELVSFNTLFKTRTLYAAENRRDPKKSLSCVEILEITDTGLSPSVIQ